MIALENSVVKELSKYEVTIYEFEVFNFKDVEIHVELQKYSDHGYIPVYQIQTKDEHFEGVLPMVKSEEEALAKIEPIIMEVLNKNLPSHRVSL